MNKTGLYLPTSGPVDLNEFQQDTPIQDLPGATTMVNQSCKSTVKNKFTDTLNACQRNKKMFKIKEKRM